MIKPVAKACFITSLVFLLTALAVIFYARSLDDKPVRPAIKPSEQIATMQAAAFCSYGWDENGIDYGPGYVIVSSYCDIPLYSLLNIDQYGEAQVIRKSEGLEKNEILVWYNAPSKVDMFGQQTVKVKIRGKGDKPCAIP